MKAVKLKDVFSKQDGVIIPLFKQAPQGQRRPKYINKLDEISKEITKKVNAKLAKKSKS